MTTGGHALCPRGHGCPVLALAFTGTDVLVLVPVPELEMTCRLQLRFMCLGCSVVSAQLGLTTSVSSLGVKKVYCNHLGRNRPGFPDIDSNTRRGEGGEAQNKVTLMEH